MIGPDFEAFVAGPHVMIDIETLGTRADAAIVAIGAVVFSGQAVDRRWSAVIKLADACARGTIDSATLGWWMRQSDAARSIFNNRYEIGLPSALRDLSSLFADWRGRAPFVWSHGAGFDIPILENAYRATGIPVPWSYRAIRDTRTLFSLTGTKVGPYGIAHNALDDAIAQALAVQAAFARLATLQEAA